MSYRSVLFIATNVLGPVITHMTKRHPTQQNKVVEVSLSTSSPYKTDMQPDSGLVTREIFNTLSSVFQRLPYE